PPPPPPPPGLARPLLAPDTGCPSCLWLSGKVRRCGNRQPATASLAPAPQSAAPRAPETGTGLEIPTGTTRPSALSRQPRLDATARLRSSRRTAPDRPTQ